jgi:hypothetical protein
MRTAGASAAGTYVTNFGAMAANMLTKNPYMGVAFGAVHPIWSTALGMTNRRFAPYASAYTACALYPWVLIATWKLGLADFRDAVFPYPEGHGPEVPLPTGDEAHPADSMAAIFDPIGATRRA